MEWLLPWSGWDRRLKMKRRFSKWAANPPPRAQLSLRVSHEWTGGGLQSVLHLLSPFLEGMASKEGWIWGLSSICVRDMYMRLHGSETHMCIYVSSFSWQRRMTWIKDTKLCWVPQKFTLRWGFSRTWLVKNCSQDRPGKGWPGKRTGKGRKPGKGIGWSGWEAVECD